MSELPEHKNVGNLFYLDRKFLVDLGKTSEDFLKEPSSSNKAKLKALLKILKKCLVTQSELRKVDNMAAKVAINGGLPFKKDYSKKLEKVKKISDEDFLNGKAKYKTDKKGTKNKEEGEKTKIKKSRRKKTKRNN
jgi:hypothetical protein